MSIFFTFIFNWYILMCMNHFYTYLLIDPRDNRPFYVGKGCKRRMTIHERRSKLGQIPNNNVFLFNKIKKILSLGLGIKYKQCIKNIAAERALFWETKIISCLRKHGYELCNISDGGLATRGHTGKKHSDEARLKMGRARKGQFTLKWFVEKYGENGNRLYQERCENIRLTSIGRISPPITEETRNKLIQSHIGKKQSEETKAKRSKSMMGKFVGRKVSEETKIKISRGLKGRKSPMKNRKHTTESVLKMTMAHLKTYDLISPNGENFHFTGLKNFCKEKGINYGNMSSVATGKRKSCGGWKLAQSPLHDLKQPYQIGPLSLSLYSYGPDMPISIQYLT